MVASLRPTKSTTATAATAVAAAAATVASTSKPAEDELVVNAPAPAPAAGLDASSRLVMAEALFGAFGSAGACLASHPIDVARVRIQLGGSRGTLGTLANICRSEGVLALTRGLQTAVAYNVVLNGVRFSTFHALTTELDLSPFGSGLLAGALSGLVSSPLARARTIQAAADSGAAAGLLGANPTQASTARSQLRLPSALEIVRLNPFAGASSWSLRNGGHTACIFTLHETLKERIAAACPWLPPWALHLTASLRRARLVRADVARRRRVHAHVPSVEPAARRPTRRGRRRVLGAARLRGAAVRTDGVRGFLRGLTANVMRIVPHTVLTFALVELMRDASRSRLDGTRDGTRASSRRSCEPMSAILRDPWRDPASPLPRAASLRSREPAPMVREGRCSVWRRTPLGD